MSTPRVSSWVHTASILISFFVAVAAYGKPSSSTYTRPLLFAPEDNNIFLTSPQLKWDLEGDRLSFGGIAFDGKAIKFIANTNDNVFNLGFGWPNNLGYDGKIQIRVAGKVVWEKSVDSSDVSSWRNQLKTNPKIKPLIGTNFGVTRNTVSDFEAFKNNPEAQACFVRKNSETEWLDACSALMQVTALPNKTIQLTHTTRPEKPTVQVFGEDLGTRGLANFPGDKPVQFKSIFSDGSTLSFAIAIPHLRMLDVVWKGEQATGKEFLVFTGQGAKPLGEVKNLVVPPDHFWSATGLDEEVIWQTTIPKHSPLLRVIAPFNIPFTYIVQFTDLPDETDRIFISSRTGAGTYARTPKIFGVIPSQAKLSSKEKSVRKSSPNEFEWKFLAPKKGERNKARISLFKMENGKEKEWVAHYQLYRGYPFQAALRLTGLSTEKLETAIVGEASFTYFPDTIFLNSYLLDYHRWGFSFRYFNILTPLEINQIDEDTQVSTPVQLKPFNTVNADFRYNINPGLWNRDELFGPIFSYGTVSIVDYRGQFAGIGAFWARTMPRFIDKLFNINPLFRYPKYVDVEFIYYPVGLGGVLQSKTWFLNFSGRVFWTKRFFGEGGFGYKSFSFSPRDEDLSALNFGMGYGTAGLGLTF